MSLDRYQMATEFQLHVFEREVANITDIKELRRVAIRLKATTIHQEKLYEALMHLD